MAGLYPALADSEKGEAKTQMGAAPKRKNAVLVLGSTGKMGRALVKQVRPPAGYQTSQRCCLDAIDAAAAESILYSASIDATGLPGIAP